jgi:hypothetical protein
VCTDCVSVSVNGVSVCTDGVSIRTNGVGVPQMSAHCVGCVPTVLV